MADLNKLIKMRESDTLEFKLSLSDLKRITEIVASFCNTKGGRLLIGIDEKENIKGIDIGKQSLERLANTIADNTDPVIYPRISCHELKGKEVISIEVKESSNKPHLAFGRAFKRVGNVTKMMERSEYEELLFERRQIYFDSQICKEAKLVDLDLKIIEEFIKKYEDLSKTEIVGKPKSLLKSLGVIKDDKIMNSGILLFAKKPQKFFPNAYIAIAHYRGVEVGVERLDYKELHSNLFNQIDKAEKYIRDHIATISRLVEGQVQRQDIPEYPLFAIRELVVNAVAHRDYSEFGSKIIIKMFSDRIEYYNPGGLPKGITPENILERQKSRNPIIARILNRVKYIEELGEGWNRIIKEFKEHPLSPKMPEIKDFGDAFLVTIYGAKTDPLEKLKGKLNERQIKALGYLKKTNFLKASKYAKLFSITDRQARRDISKLVELNLLIKQGKAGSTRYKLCPEMSGNVRKLI